LAACVAILENKFGQMSALLSRPAPMPPIEMADFHCVSPACFPVIEMAGFRFAPSSDPVVEIREAKEEEQEPSPNRAKLRSSPQLLSMSSINYFSPARRSQSFAVRPVWRSPAIRLGGLYVSPFSPNNRDSKTHN
jgi:hypothetical protein